MIDFTKYIIKIRRLTLDNILLGKKKIKIKLIIRDKIEKLVLILTNVFYLINSSSNIVSLDFLNNIIIHHYNKDQNLIYNLKIQRTFAFAK